jgi:hypothetical protein
MIENMVKWRDPFEKAVNALGPRHRKVYSSAENYKFSKTPRVTFYSLPFVFQEAINSSYYIGLSIVESLA